MGIVWAYYIDRGGNRIRLLGWIPSEGGKGKTPAMLMLIRIQHADPATTLRFYVHETLPDAELGALEEQTGDGAKEGV